MQVMVTLSPELTICCGRLGNMIPLFLFNSLARKTQLWNNTETEINTLTNCSLLLEKLLLRCFTIFDWIRNNLLAECTITSRLAPHIQFTAVAAVNLAWICDDTNLENPRPNKENGDGNKHCSATSFHFNFCMSGFFSSRITGVRDGREPKPKGQKIKQKKNWFG